MAPAALAYPPAPPAAPSPGIGQPVLDISPSGGSAPPWPNPLGGGSPLEPRDAKAGAAKQSPVGGGAAAPSTGLVFKAEPPPMTVEDESDYDVVEVLYGTDRLAGEQKASDAGHLLLQFLPPLLVAGLAVCL